jgi:hypothetical protein
VSRLTSKGRLVPSSGFQIIEGFSEAACTAAQFDRPDRMIAIIGGHGAWEPMMVGILRRRRLRIIRALRHRIEMLRTRNGGEA